MSAPVAGVSLLPGLAPVPISGADARTYLQGQLSADLRKLAPTRALLASCNSPRGRVQCILTVLQRDDGIVALFPAALRQRMIGRLRAYVLRSKVMVDDSCGDSAAGLAAASLSPAQAAALTPVPPREAGEVAQVGPLSILRWWSADERYVLLGPRSALTVDAATEEDAGWHRADIAAGLPEIHPQTHELFIAQMLNLDLLGGICFDKGCYTGQEIIARTHFRSSVKRRMFRFAAPASPPTPGTRVVCGNEHVGDVVDAAVVDGGGSELLASVKLDHLAGPLALGDASGAFLTRLTLPYEVREDRTPPAHQVRAT